MFTIFIFFIIALFFPSQTQAAVSLPNDSVVVACKEVKILSGAFDPSSKLLKLELQSPSNNQISLQGMTLTMIGGKTVNLPPLQLSHLSTTGFGRIDAFINLVNFTQDELATMFPQLTNQTSVKESFTYQPSIGNNQSTTSCNNGNAQTDPDIGILLGPLDQQVPVQSPGQGQTPGQQQIPPGGIPALASAFPTPGATALPACTPEDIAKGRKCTLGGGIPCDQNDPLHPGLKTAIGCIHTNPAEFARDLMKFIISIGGGLAFLMMLIGAFQMLTSAGNPDSLNAGKERLTSAVIGLMLVIFATLLLQIIGVNILDIPGFSK